MANPVLSPSDQQDIQQRITDLQEEIVNNVQAIANTEVQIAEEEAKEQINYNLWEYYQSIAHPYDIELKYLSGEYVESPVMNSDVIDRGNLEGRLYDPSQEEPDVVRIDEFDNANAAIIGSAYYEQYFATFYDFYLNLLVNGLATNVAIPETTVTVLDSRAHSPGETDVIYVNSDENLSANQEVIFNGGGQQFVAKLLDVSPIEFCGNPEIIDEGICDVTGGVWNGDYCTRPQAPNQEICELLSYSWISTVKLDVEYITECSVPLPAGSTLLGEFPGFSNSERASRTSGDFQLLMDYLLDNVDTAMANHISALAYQLSAYNVNLDPNKNIAVLGQITAAQSFYGGYSPFDVTDSGISAFNSFHNTRVSQVTARIAEIKGLVQPFYDKRYDWTVARAGVNGSLVLPKLLRDNNVETAAQNVRLQKKIDDYQSEL